MNLLLIEDNQVAASALKDLLNLEGVLVELIPCGLKGIDRLNGTIPDVVVMDVLLPGCSGLEILTSMRVNPRWKDTPVILTTAASPDRMEQRFQRYDRVAFLPKPFDEEHLMDLIRSMVPVRM